MSRESLRESLAGNGSVHCLTLDFPTPALAEFAGAIGHRVLAVDLEHGNLTWSDLENLVRACEVRGTKLIAKVPMDPRIVERCLDVGVHGIHLTHVEEVHVLHEVLEFLRPGAEGSRGVNRCRANLFGHYPGGYAALALESDPVFVMVTVESLRGVEILPEVLKHELVDAVFVGAYDLSGDLGMIGKPNDPSLIQLVDKRVIAPVLEAGKVIGLSASNVHDQRNALHRGARFTLASQARLFSSASNEFLNETDKVS